MTGDITLAAAADTTTTISAEDQLTLVQPLVSMLTSPAPLQDYLGFEAQVEAIYNNAAPDEARARVSAAFNEAFDPNLHADGLTRVLKAATAYYQGQSLESAINPNSARPSASTGEAEHSVAFLYSNGIWTPGYAPKTTVDIYLKPRLQAAGFPDPLVRSILNSSGIDDPSPGLAGWLCIMALGKSTGGLALALGVFKLKSCLSKIGVVTGALEDLGESAFQFFLPKAQFISADAQRLANAIRTEYKTNNRFVVVIAHSQGNLVTSEALKVLASESPLVVPPQCVGVVSLAPPRRITGTPHVRDMIIRDGIAKDILALLLLDDLGTPSEMNALSNELRKNPFTFLTPFNLLVGAWLHDVEESYLSSPETPKSVSDAIRVVVDNVRSTCTSLASALITVQANVPTAWSISPGGLSGTGTSGSYTVTPAATGTTYTIAPQSIAEHQVAVTTSSGPGSNLTLLPGQSKSFTLTYTTVGGPAPPTLIGPGTATAPGPPVVTLTPTFTWNAASGASGYGLYVRDLTTDALIYPNPSGTTTTPLTGTSFVLPAGILQAGRGYRWWMTSFAGATESTQSPVRYFQTQGTTPPSGVVIPTFITAGFDHTCGLTTTGAAFCWGLGQNGRLGTGNTINTVSPAPVTGGVTFMAIAAGDHHTCGLTVAGTAYCWGLGGEGQLGNGSTIDRTAPTLVAGGHIFIDIAAGGAHTCAIANTGMAYCWGSGSSGALGNGGTNDRAVPTAVAGNNTFASITAGFSHTCSITTSGAAYCWGQGLFGQLGDGSTANRVSPIAVTGGNLFSSLSAGAYHTCGVTLSSSGLCWGAGAQFELGNGVAANRSQPTAIAGAHQFSALTAGGTYTCGVTLLWVSLCWGTGPYGQLGDGAITPRGMPVTVSGGHLFAALVTGTDHTCGITTSGSAFCWGLGGAGQLGTGFVDNFTTPTPVTGGLIFRAAVGVAAPSTTEVRDDP